MIYQFYSKLQLCCLILLLKFTLFISCKSNDGISPSSARVEVIDIKYCNLGSVPEANERELYVFEYDSRGRVIKVNDKEFKYDNGGKVKSSRIHYKKNETINREDGVSIYEYEYIEQLNYNWDPQGRLSTIEVDSMLIRESETRNSIRLMVKEEVVRNVVVASYEYRGSISNPSTIIYRKINMSYEIPSSMNIGLDENVVYDYSDEYINNEKREFAIFAPIPPDFPPYSNYLHAFIYYKYSEVEHYLYSIYKQMGFNPCKYWEVVPARLENERFLHIEKVDFEGVVSPDWSNSLKSTIEYYENNMIIRMPSDFGQRGYQVEVTYNLSV